MRILITFELPAVCHHVNSNQKINTSPITNTGDKMRPSRGVLASKNEIDTDKKNIYVGMKSTNSLTNPGTLPAPKKLCPWAASALFCLLT